MSFDSHVDPQGPSESTPRPIPRWFTDASGQQPGAAWPSSHSASSAKVKDMYELLHEVEKDTEATNVYRAMFGGGWGQLEEEQGELVEVTCSDGRTYMCPAKHLEHAKSFKTVAELEEEKRRLIACLQTMMEEHAAMRKGLNNFISLHIVPSMLY